MNLSSEILCCLFIRHLYLSPALTLILSNSTDNDNQSTILVFHFLQTFDILVSVSNLNEIHKRGVKQSAAAAYMTLVREVKQGEAALPTPLVSEDLSSTRLNDKGVPMSDFTRKRISIQNAKIDMELAEDAITPNGMLLVAKNTKITDKHLFRMNLYQIMSIVIKDFQDTDEIFDETSDAPVTDVIISESQPKTETFRHFKGVFDKVEHNVKNQFDAISDGDTIDSKSMVTTIEALMGSLRLKSELFTYMNHLMSDDNHTYVHSINVAMLCNIFGHWLKMNDAEIEELTLAGMIHDIGMVKIDTTLLNKPGKLSAEEFEAIQQHTKLGYDIVREQHLPEKIKLGVLMHHERNDGSGYPLGLKGESIPDFAKIIAIVDVYDAMTSSRSYHNKFSPFRVIQMFEQESYGYLDTKYLFIFLENIAHYYLGETARLSDGTEAKIVFIHNTSPSRPIVQAGSQMIDLLTNHQLNIEEIL